MSAGTITLTNKSKSITGVNTTFNTELSAGDFIVVTVGGIPYTLPVGTVNNNTSLTLVSEYSGPTQAGAAWYAVPRVAQNMITAALVSQGAEALRGLNYDKDNWQQVFSNSNDITVTLPDYSQYKGPSWLKLSQSLSGINSELSNKVNSKDLGDAAKKNTGSTTGTVAAGDDARLNTVNQKTGGAIIGNTAIRNGGLEIYAPTPFLDFHYGNTEEDFSLRLLNEPYNRLNVFSYGGNRARLFVSGGVLL